MANLRPFSGMSTKCKKCLCVHVDARWFPEGAVAAFMAEHLVRTCRVCGYTWREASADAA